MAGGYSITITAVDKATTTVDAINKRFEQMNKRIALARAPFDQMEQSFSKFTKVTGLARIATGFSDVAKQGTEAFRSMLRVVEPLAAITGAASVAGLYRLASAWAQFGTQLGQQATRAGLSADKLLALQGAARLAGVDAGTLTTGITTLNDNLRNAAFGAAPGFIQALQAIGIKYDDIRNKSPDDALKIIADKLAKVENPADRAAYRLALFGGAADGLDPLLRKGSKGITDLTDDAARLGRQLGDDGVSRANAFNAAQGRLEIATKGVASALGDKLGVALTPLLNQFATWLGTSPAVTAGLNAAGEAAQHFAAWLSSVDWKAVGEGIATIWHNVDAVATALGGWTRVGEGLIVFFTGRFLIQMMLPFAKIAAAMLLVPKQAAEAAAKAGAELDAIGKKGAGGGLGRGPLGGILGLLGSMNLWSVASDALSGSAPVPTEDAMQRNNIGHGFLQDLIERVWGGAKPAGYKPQAPNGVPGTGPLFGPQITTGPSQPSAFTNNNPTNLEYYPGQPGLVGRNGRWGVYDTAAHGIGAGFNQMLRDQAKGFTTIASEITHRSPPSENDTAGMIRDISGMSGLNPDAPLNLHDPDVARRFMQAVVRRETGKTPSWEDVDAGIKPYMPASAPAAPNAPVATPPSGEPVAAPSPVPNGAAGPPGASGQVNMNVKVDGAAQVTTTSTGGVHVEVRNPSMAY